MKTKKSPNILDNSDDGDTDENYNDMKIKFKLLTTLLASQEKLHRTHLSAPLWTQMNSKMKKKKNTIQTFVLHCQSE